MDNRTKATGFPGEIPDLESWRIDGYRRIVALHAFRRACWREFLSRTFTRLWRLPVVPIAGDACGTAQERAGTARIGLDRIERASEEQKLPLHRYRELWLALFLDDDLVDRSVLRVRYFRGRILLAGGAGEAVRLSVLRARGVRHVAVAITSTQFAEIRRSVFGGTIPGNDVGYHYENENDDCCNDPGGDAQCVHGAGFLL